MKKLVLIMSALVFAAACSSKPKADETATTSDTEKKVMEATDSTSNTMEAAETPEEKKAAKKAKQSAATDTTTSEVTTGASTTTEFGAINGTEKSSVTCTNKSDSRKISVLSVSEGGCGVVYNKMGEDKTVAVAKVDMNYCDTVSSKIKTNLEGAGFSCDGAAAAPSTPATGTSSDTSAQ